MFAVLSFFCTRNIRNAILLTFLVFYIPAHAQVVITGQLKKWHKVTLTFESGIPFSETSAVNPFTDYRLNVTFTNGSKTYKVPGYYAADGNAAQTSAAAGSKWRVHFCADKTGTWTYSVSFRTGPYVSISDDAAAGSAVSPLNGLTGSFVIQPTDKSGCDFRAKGKLQYTGEHYLKFAETGEYFLKGGCASPENFLAYWEFDGTYDNGGATVGLPNGLHQYPGHVNDWKTGDPSWQNGKGKGIIGALNYLTSQEVNSFYFLTMNIDGDGNDVWPYISPLPTDRERFDVSKLDQWEIVFSHMDSLGILLHFITQERENQMLLDNGNLGNQRKLYYHELIARFSHHPAIIWNLGEENGWAYMNRGAQSDQQRKDMAAYFKSHDPYHSFITVHSSINDVTTVYTPLLGDPDIDGMSLQAYYSTVNNLTVQWRGNSENSGKDWVIFHDETSGGVMPDGAGNNYSMLRKNALWGNYMGGGGGVAWYFNANDLNAETFTNRSGMWMYTRHAQHFFKSYLPYWQMSPNNSLTPSTNDFVLEKPGVVYAVFLSYGGLCSINLPQGNYTIKWYDPKNGGALQNGSKLTVSGGGTVSIGNPPFVNDDWVALITNNQITNCDDGNPCTIDLANNGQCLNNPIICNDQNSCTADACSNGICIYSVIICNDNVPCTNDACVNGQCLFTPIICNDNNTCTSDGCANGLCVFTPINCNDYNACTMDACVNGACSYSTIICNDNLLCTNDACVNGRCTYTPISCNDNNACTSDVCVNGQCTFTHINCNDNNACTTDACTNGTCVYSSIICNDNFSCTNDACVNGQCLFIPLSCNDNNACTTDGCANGQCAFIPMNCNDNNACTMDACNNGVCVYSPFICNDHSLCTNDACVNGQCIFTPVSCNDNNLCTTDACANGQCIYIPIICTDNNSCTLDGCDAGRCTYTPITCSDNNLCTTDECANGNCIFSPIPNCCNVPSDCDDNDNCTLDECKNSQCAHLCIGNSLQWQKSFGGSDDEVANSIEQTNDGGYIMCGFSKSANGNITGALGGKDFWIVKTDTDGNIQFQKSFGGSNDDIANCIQQTVDGGYIVAGETKSNNGNVSGLLGGKDFWVIKLNATGGLAWQKTLGGSSDDIANYIQQTADGGYIVVGETKSNNGNVTGLHGGKDFWVVKLNATGGITWQKALGGNTDDIATCVRQTTDGGFIVAGQTKSNNGDVTGNHGDNDFWIVRLNATGTVVFKKVLGGSNDDSAQSVKQTDDGGYIISGYTKSTNGDVVGNHGDYDFWVIKLDASGNLQFKKALGGSGDDSGRSVQQTSDGGYIVAGYSASTNGDVESNFGNYDFWMVKLDAAGNKLFQKNLGGSNEDKAYCVRQTDEGGYIIAGGSKSKDDKASFNYGRIDFWAVKLGCVPGVPCGAAKIPVEIAPAPTANSNDDLLLNVYPNPFSDKLNIEFTLSKDSNVKLEILTLTGQRIALVLEGYVKAEEMQRVSYRPLHSHSSMILYRLQTENGIYFGKVMLENR